MNFLESIKYPPSDQLFLTRLFTLISRGRKEEDRHDYLKKILTEEFDDLTRRAERSELQSPFQIRNLIKARRLSEFFIDDKGDIKGDLIKKAVEVLQNNQYPLGAKRESDLISQKRILKLLLWLSDPSSQKKLKMVSKPLSHRQADDIIRETLNLDPTTVVTDAHARRAVLAAMFTDLRQSVGSCFATAPALLIHSENLNQFLQDVLDLLSTGRLKRVVAGIETHIPISPTFGVGDLRRPIVVDPRVDGEVDNIGFSPGLLAAFERAGLINNELTLKERVDACRSIVKSLFDKHSSPVIATAEGIIRSVLMTHFGIDDKILSDYLKRPREMVFGNLMLDMPRSSRAQKGVGEACQLFLESFDRAKKGFVVTAENALMKCWEFTLASFAESKEDFTKWNLYVSLGINAEEQGGVGAVLYSNLITRLERAKEKVEDYNREYEQLYAQLKFIEGRVQQASTEKELQWLRVEYRARLNEFQTFEQMRDREVRRHERLTSIFKVIMEKYLEMFPRYFQEIYDAEMNDVGLSFYDDRPAGFRLVYKHGRMNTSQWTRIDTPQEYSDALSSFFVATESELSHMDELYGFEQEIGEWVTMIVNHVKTKEFLESAFQRVAIKNRSPIVKNPLEHLDKIDKKPWAYTSGGSLEHLLINYFKLRDKPQVVSRWVENPTELLVFIVDTLKKLPPKVQEELKSDEQMALLMQSPTHAFRLLPNLEPFIETWQSDAFTYTDVRDRFIYPAQNFYETKEIRKDEFEFLVNEIEKELPLNYKPTYRHVFSIYPGVSSLKEMGRYFADRFETEQGLFRRGNPILNRDKIASILYKMLPIHRFGDIREDLEEIFSSFKDSWNLLKDRTREDELISAEGIYDLIQSVLLLHYKTTFINENDFEKLKTFAIEKRLIAPRPLLFADSNWPNFYFGFTVNPITNEFEFWRMDPLGVTGEPMGEWREWLDGSRKDIPWGIYTQPFEYKV